MNPDNTALFALNASGELGQLVSAKLGIPLSDHEERQFEDGEHKSRPLVSVRGKDVFVVQSLYGDHQQSVNDKLCRLLFFIGALRDASANEITAVVPYLCYARKDQKTKPRDPVTIKYVAAVLEAVGVNRVVTLDVHNLAAFQNAFRCHTDHLEAKQLFTDYFRSLLVDGDAVVVSPDVGGIKRAEHFREALVRAVGRPVGVAFMDKRRSEGVVAGESVVVGDVQGRVAIIIDDLISTGTTLARAARACCDQGARKVYAAASHGVFVGDAGQILANSALEKIVITNSIPPLRLSDKTVHAKLVILDATVLLAEAIRRISEGGSIVELLDSSPSGLLPGA